MMSKRAMRRERRALRAFARWFDRVVVPKVAQLEADNARHIALIQRFTKDKLDQMRRERLDRINARRCGTIVSPTNEEVVQVLKRS